MTPNPETNMVYFDPAETGLSNDAFLAQLQSHGVRMGLVLATIVAHPEGLAGGVEAWAAEVDPAMRRY